MHSHIIHHSIISIIIIYVRIRDKIGRNVTLYSLFLTFSVINIILKPTEHEINTIILVLHNEILHLERNKMF